MLKIAIDVFYFGERAKASAVAFEDWNAEQPVYIENVWIQGVQEYIPGEFYKRELPCLLGVLDKFENLDQACIIIDGYVYLSDNEKPGLGLYLYEALNRKTPVIGVAKRAFFENQKLVKEIIRGESRNPLYVTAIGTELNEAGECIKNMKGQYRIPDLLKLADTLCRKEE